MTNKNPYEKSSSFFEKDDDTVTIPDFVEDRTGNSSNSSSTFTDSTSVDMSIFKMSDDELYDDVDKKEAVEEYRPRKKSKATLVLSLLLIGLLLLTSIGAIIYALKQRNSYVEANTKYLQLQANQEEYQKQIAEKDAKIEELRKEIEELKSKPAVSGTVFEIIDGPITFRKTPGVDGETTSYKGKEQAENGETYTVLEVIEDENDEGRKWAKISDNVYFCIGYWDSIWAEEVE